LGVVAERHDASIDRLYVMPGTRTTTKSDDSVVEVLTRERLAEITIPDEMNRYIGRIDRIHDCYPNYGVVQDNTLVALAEANVCDSEVAAIQQVVTLSGARRRGLGRSVVRHIALDLLARGMVPTYFTDESNRASASLAESIGFELDSRWGYTDLQ
jgi:predicted GNAT family acetyltransferase